ncbi:MAG: hypothetical protein M1831_000307 [Alyxoria varia]|nr:MAG: hypothetical protein M1831_000307 [Alyxoria varia]
MAAPQSPPESPPAQNEDDFDVSHPSVPYSAQFTDSLMNEGLRQSKSALSGTPVIPRGIDNPARNSSAVRVDQIEQKTFPLVNDTELPLPLSDSRRTYQNSAPSSKLDVRLTHPGGSFVGGTLSSLAAHIPQRGKNEDSELDTWARQLVQRERIKSPQALRAALAKEVAREEQELERRMKARQKAIEHNEEVEKRVKRLEDQRNLERKLANAHRESTKRRRESTP